MQKIYTASDIFHLYLIRNQLDFLGIETQIRNEFLSGAMGELSFLDCGPELWLVDERQTSAAKVAIERLLTNEPTNEKTPTCTVCGEQSPENFQRCWQCQAPLNL
jgi:hypothetical protein